MNVFIIEAKYLLDSLLTIDCGLILQKIDELDIKYWYFRDLLSLKILVPKEVNPSLVLGKIAELHLPVKVTHEYR